MSGDAWRRLGQAGPNAGELELLRAALLEGDEGADAWRRWLPDHVIDTIPRRSSDLLPAVAANLSDEVLGDEAGRLRGIRRRVWAENQFGLAALCDAVGLLRDVGIEPIVAKGASLATTVFDAAGTRAMADVDLIVGPAHIDDAVDALTAAGWTAMDAVEGPFFHAVALVDSRGRGVDLHRWVVFPRFTPIPERSWLERALPHQVFDTPVRRLADGDELVLSILHGLLTSSDSSSRWPIDVVKLVRAAVSTGREAALWSSVVESATELKVGPVVADGVALCTEELGIDAPTEVTDALRSGPVDPALGRHWQLCRRGITPEWRIRRYVRLARSEGQRPSVAGYVRPRLTAIRTRGLREVIAGRLGRARDIVADRTRA